MADVTPPPGHYGHHSTRSSIVGALSVSGAIKEQRSRSKKMPIPVPGLTKKTRGRKPQRTADGSRQHVCYVPGCGSFFQRVGHLTRHVNSIHTNNKCAYHLPDLVLMTSFTEHAFHRHMPNAGVWTSWQPHGQFEKACEEISSEY